jgi:hypothetical protein
MWQVLCYSYKGASRSTVRRYYAIWRKEKGLPTRCDIPTCVFHTQPPTWGGKPLPLILDHTNGNRRDNSPENLRCVCPNCDAQLSTRGGANRGRVQEATEHRYVLVSRDGKRDDHIIPPSTSVTMTAHPPTILITPRQAAEPDA